MICILCLLCMFRQLVPLLTNKDVSLIMRGSLYSSCVRSSMLHGSETWPVSPSIEPPLSVCMSVWCVVCFFIILDIYIITEFI